MPTITIASDFDGPAIDGTSYRNKFSGKYSHRILAGIGHNVPQEAPQEFANGVMSTVTDRPGADLVTAAAKNRQLTPDIDDGRQ